MTSAPPIGCLSRARRIGCLVAVAPPLARRAPALAVGPIVCGAGDSLGGSWTARRPGGPAMERLRDVRERLQAWERAFQRQRGRRPSQVRDALGPRG